MTPLENSNDDIISIDNIIAEQNKSRGYDIPEKLESDLLIKRIKDGGRSGVFLANAFLSVYKMTPFKLSLGSLVHIDVEGMRLFNQVLHLRHIKDWSDDEYKNIAELIQILLKMEVS